MMVNDKRESSLQNLDGAYNLRDPFEVVSKFEKK